MENGLALALGAAVAAEATGVTNISGGSGRGDVSIEVPTKGPDSPIPSPGEGGSSLDPSVIAELANSGPSLEEIAAVTQQNSGPSEGLLEVLAATGSQPAQIAQGAQDAAGNVPTAEQVRQYVDEQIAGGNNGGSSGGSGGGGGGGGDPLVEPTGAEPSTTGGKIGQNVGQAAWHGAVKPLASAIDQNTALSGDASDNINDVTDPVADAGSGVAESVGSALNPFDGERSNEGPLTNGASPGDVANTVTDTVDSYDRGIGSDDTNDVNDLKDDVGNAVDNAKDALGGLL